MCHSDANYMNIPCLVMPQYSLLGHPVYHHHIIRGRCFPMFTVQFDDNSLGQSSEHIHQSRNSTVRHSLKCITLFKYKYSECQVNDANNLCIKNESHCEKDHTMLCCFNKPAHICRNVTWFIVLRFDLDTTNVDKVGRLGLGIVKNKV